METSSLHQILRGKLHEIRCVATKLRARSKSIAKGRARDHDNTDVQTYLRSCRFKE